MREQHIAKWKEQSRIAEEEARKLAQNLKESRETKLFRKRKRTESLSNMNNIPPTKQPAPQHENLIEALTGIIGNYSKNGQEEQQPQQQQSSKGKGPANGREFPRKRGLPNTH